MKYYIQLFKDLVNKICSCDSRDEALIVYYNDVKEAYKRGAISKSDCRMFMDLINKL